MLRRTVVIVPIAIVILSAQLLAQTQRMTPTAPGSAGDPAWQATLRLSDGRTFVTDGGFAIDAAIAKPSKLPDRELPSKVLEDYFKAAQTEECRFGDLTADSGKSYRTPGGIALNAAYIDFLKRIVPSRSVRFRMTGAMRPVLVESDGKMVGVLMPLAP